MVADGRGVPPLGVPPAGRAKNGSGWRWERANARSPHRGCDEPQPPQNADPGRLPAPEKRHDAVEVVGVELAADVRPAQAELAGRTDQMPDRARGLDEERGPMSRRGDAGAIPELDREWAVRQGPLDAAPKPIGA